MVQFAVIKKHGEWAVFQDGSMRERGAMRSACIERAEALAFEAEARGETVERVSVASRPCAEKGCGIGRFQLAHGNSGPMIILQPWKTGENLDTASSFSVRFALVS